MFWGAAGAEKMHFRVFFIRKILILEGDIATQREDIADWPKKGRT